MYIICILLSNFNIFLKFNFETFCQNSKLAKIIRLGVQTEKGEKKKILHCFKPKPRFLLHSFCKGNDADIMSNCFKVYQRRKKKLDQASLWLDGSYLSLICHGAEDPPLYCGCDNNQWLDPMPVHQLIH